MHLGSSKDTCPQLTVHGSDMKRVNSEKYLGDYITDSGKLNETLDDRKNKAFGIVADISAIISEVPFGKHKSNVGLHLRQAMLLNGIL